MCLDKNMFCIWSDLGALEDIWVQFFGKNTCGI